MWVVDVRSKNTSYRREFIECTNTTCHVHDKIDKISKPGDVCRYSTVVFLLGTGNDYRCVWFDGVAMFVDLECCRAVVLGRV